MNRQSITLFLLVILLGAIIGPAAMAHHNKGLPHYGYFKNYPQVPTEEFIIIDGRWEVGAVLFNFQGLERSSSDTPDDVKFFAYAYDLKRDEAVKGDMSFDIVKKGTVLATKDMDDPNSESVYVIRHTMPSSGNYDLVFRFTSVEGEDVAVPLRVTVDLSADGINWVLLGVMTAIFAVIFALAMTGRKRKHKALAAPAPTHKVAAQL